VRALCALHALSNRAIVLATAHTVLLHEHHLKLIDQCQWLNMKNERPNMSKARHAVDHERPIMEVRRHICANLLEIIDHLNRSSPAWHAVNDGSNSVSTSGIPASSIWQSSWAVPQLRHWPALWIGSDNSMQMPVDERVTVLQRLTLLRVTIQARPHFIWQPGGWAGCVRTATVWLQISPMSGSAALHNSVCAV
jgi:hypothetical protein